MQVIKASHLFDGINERKDVFIGFENDTIQYVENTKPEEEAEVVVEDKDIVVTPAFIDSHSHIGLQRSAEYSGQYEENNEWILLVQLLMHYIVYSWTILHSKNP